MGEDPGVIFGTDVLLRTRAKSWGRDIAWHEPILVLRPERLEVGDEVRVDAWVKLECGEGLILGPWVHVASFAHLGIGGGQVELGAESAVASGGKILSGSADPAWPSMSAAARPTRQTSSRCLTSIGPRAVVCTNAVVLPGCHLGEGAILAAGGVATRPIPAWEIWGGVPARCLRSRPWRTWHGEYMPPTWAPPSD